MALRDFTDRSGRSWTVWAVKPTSDLRLRSTPSAPGDHHELLRDGWLVFECAGERRRLVPIPQDWDDVDDQTLERLCARAEQVPTRRRLID